MYNHGHAYEWDNACSYSKDHNHLCLPLPYKEAGIAKRYKETIDRTQVHATSVKISYK